MAIHYLLLVRRCDLGASLVLILHNNPVQLEKQNIFVLLKSSGIIENNIELLG